MSGKVRDSSASGPMPPARVWKTLYLPPAALLAVIVLGAVIKDLPVGTMTRDISAIADVHPFTGVLTSIGVLIWFSAAAVSAFSALVLHRRGDRREAFFLLCSGLLTAWLVFDDLFLLHEELGAEYLGLSSGSIIGTHAFLAVVYLAVFLGTILDTEYYLLVAAFAFFALSLFVDSFNLPSETWWLLVEDGTKFFGIVSWSAYYIRAALGFLLRPPPPPPVSAQV